MAGLARAIDVQQRRTHVMVADLQSPFPLVRHMTISASHTGARVNALVPHFKLRVLSLECGRARLSMFPVFKLLLVVEGQDVFYLQPFGPGIDKPLFGSTEVILVMTLTAY